MEVEVESRHGDVSRLAGDAADPFQEVHLDRCDIDRAPPCAGERDRGGRQGSHDGETHGGGTSGRALGAYCLGERRGGECYGERHAEYPREHGRAHRDRVRDLRDAE